MTTASLMALKSSFTRVKSYVVDRWWPPLSAATDQSSELSPKIVELTLRDVMMKLEPMLASLQNLLIWDKPYVSAVAFLVFNCIYWGFVCFNRFRFYCILFLILFCFQFIKLWANYIWPEIRVPPNESTDTEGWIPVHPQVLSAPEINYYINELCVLTKALVFWFVRLRRDKPLKFCITTTCLLLMTAIIGRLVPGVIIVYSIMMTMALGPGVVLYVFPEGLYELLRNFFIPNQNDDETDRNPDRSEDPDDIPDRELLSESALHQYLMKTEFKEFELNPFEANDDSSLQLLSDTQLDLTLDKELSDDDLRLDSLSSRSSRSSGSSNGAIRFVSSHFSRNNSSDNIEEEFELISDSEVRDSAKGSQNISKHKKV